jgi:beta-glucanase (GH16 family)
MKKLLLCTLGVLFLLGCQTNSAPKYSGYVLDWQDDFNKKEINKDIWRHAVGGGGFGNFEMQYYTNKPENSRTENGKLIIETRKEKMIGHPYTSAKLITKERKEMLYGRIEVRAKLPEGRGNWPAIWMLPVDSQGYGFSWPDSGEIDIMEHVGFDPGNVHFSIHTEAYNHKIGTHKTGIKKIPDATTEFHTYGIEWTPDFIRWYVDSDENTVFTFKNEKTDYKAWPFDKPFYLILNTAVGGTWGGRNGVDNEAFPYTMEIDYVRYYKMEN